MTVLDVIVIFLSGVMSTLYYDYTHGKDKKSPYQCTTTDKDL